VRIKEGPGINHNIHSLQDPPLKLALWADPFLLPVCLSLCIVYEGPSTVRAEPQERA